MHLQQLQHCNSVNPARTDNVNKQREGHRANLTLSPNFQAEKVERYCSGLHPVSCIFVVWI